MSNIQPINLLNIQNINSLLDNLDKIYSQVSIKYLGQIFLEKMFPVFERCV